jgi:hypothetical protein
MQQVIYDQAPESENTYWSYKITTLYDGENFEFEWLGVYVIPS